jgi:Apg6 coiled-coil region
MSSPSPSPGALVTVDMGKNARPSSSIKYQIVCCQRCHQMLDVESNFHQLEETILSELSSESARNSDSPHSAAKNQPILEDSSDATDDIRQRLRTAALETNTNDDEETDCLPLGRRQIAFTRDTTDDEEKTNKLRLMELLSDVSTVDHPICSSCTDSVMEELEVEIQSVEKECGTYEYFLKQFKKNLADGSDGETVMDLSALQMQLKELEMEEELLRKQMKEAEEERQVCSDGSLD